MLYWSFSEIYFDIPSETYPLPIIVYIGKEFWNWGHVISKMSETHWKRKNELNKITAYKLGHEFMKLLPSRVFITAKIFYINK